MDTQSFAGHPGLAQAQPDFTNQWLDGEQYETYLALLGLAESLRKQGNVEGSYKCLMAILGLQIPFAVSARIHCEVGKLLLRETENTDLAKQFLDKAVSSRIETLNYFVSLLFSG